MLPQDGYKRFGVPMSMFDWISGYIVDDTYAINIGNQMLFTKIKPCLFEGTDWPIANDYH
jgi:hypothetical protein